MSARWTEQQLAEHTRNRAEKPVTDAAPAHPLIRSKGCAKRPKATIRDDGMNGLEAAWAEVLKTQLHHGEILFWKYSPGGLRLADKTFYHPDFLVIEADGTVRYDETKGFMRDDANVKIKVAASQFPFVFRLIKKKGKSWEITTI